MSVAVEICVSSVEEATVASAYGVDGLEVCSWLTCGGITPSSGLVDAVRQAVRIPVRVLIRPTPTGFHYSTVESMVLITDAEIFGGGALGLVTGALSASGQLHSALISEVKQKAPESEITFHRAIDHAMDPLRVLDDCMALGIDRILTSGGAGLAIDSVDRLRSLVDRAGEACTIAVAGGVNASNVVEIVGRTGAQEVHFAAQLPTERRGSGPALSSSDQLAWFGTRPDEAKIEAVLNALVKAGLR